jgi:hypothetical protein
MKNQKIVVVIAAHSGDFEQASRLINWIGELDGKLPYWLIIAVDQTVEVPRFTALHEAAKKVFNFVRTITLKVPETGWKPNTMFMYCAKYVHDNFSLPFLWLEPDCVPLKPGWLDAIAGAYNNSGLRYMGAIIEQTGQKNLPPRHLTGCSVYPNDAFETFDKMAEVTGGRQAWDIAGGELVATAAQNTPLIHHFWGEPKKWPVFVETKTPDMPENNVMLDFIKPEAVLFHRDKDSTLIPLLRKAKPAAELTDAELEKLTAPETPAPNTALE